MRDQDSGVAIFAEACFGPQAQASGKYLTRPFSLRRPTSCVRCVITSSRLYTTPQ
ncbi:hypothetical protein [Candidatus Reidiella endopervernicosa]|uniref:Uncharacterized protein n=1 Tax=Candidatus Reidiella endopervernicosa TaxID=2738883 RepID=A0A6N0HXD9_9GAMM|nr:hypothetical protein [Candidatus Reidiella endopervernicosa]QKQ27020.1 hypothetical protein HUE57_12590 [Candidatus Reidiella endopervernicosa]